jgi:putative ABC transport system substrate-binding protein
VLSPAAATGLALPDNINAFLRGLRAKGYVDGQNVNLEFRFAEWQLDRLPRLAAELVVLKPSVLFTHTTNGVLAARAATKEIPIVVGAAGDLVSRGVVESLARPGGNITGLTLLSRELDAKRIELLKDALPAIQQIAILVNPSNPAWRSRPDDLTPLTKDLMINLSRTDVRSMGELEAAFAKIAAAGANAVLVENDALFNEPGNRELIARISTRNRLPTISENRALADAGGLLGYGASLPAMFEYAATYVDKILKGAKPADLPVEQPTKFELVVNIKTARAIGLELSPTFLARADEVIE